MQRKARRNAGRGRPSRGRRPRDRDAGLAGVQRLEPRHALTGTPSLAGDINAQPVGSLADATETRYTPGYPYSVSIAPEFVSFAGRTVFVADDGIHGREPWVSDGTPGGTSLLKDVNATFNDFAFGGVGSDPADFFVAGGTLYFSAFDAGHGRELWKTDGTPAGTVRVKDIGQGPGAVPSPQISSNPHGFARLADGTVLFLATDDGATSGPVTTIWKTDGTEAGTVRLDQGWSTPLESGLTIGAIASFGSSALFTYGNVGDLTLWITDGTEANTRQIVSSVNAPPVNPDHFVTVTETVTPPDGFGPATSTPVAYFFAQDGLWRSDGTPAGTFRLADVQASFNDGSAPLPFGSFSRVQTEFPYGTVTGPRIVFAGLDAAGGAELWVSDGTTAGTVRRADINPAVDSTSGEGVGSGATGFVAAGSTSYFTADDGVSGRELWAYDGENVFQVADIALGAASSNPVLLGVVGSTLYFSADDGVNGRELWKADGGTAALLRDVRPGPAASFVSLSALAGRSAAVQGGGLLFAADDGQHGVELWTTDGTAAGTALVRDINVKTGDGVVATDGSGTFIGAAVIDGTVYFPATDGVHGTELWRRSGDAAPEMVADITPGAASSALSQFTVSGGKLFFTVLAPLVAPPNGDSGGTFTLWVSDGTPAGTFALRDDVSYAPTGEATRYLAPFVGGVLFAAADATHGQELWFTDGTAAGTRLVVDITDNGSTTGPNGDSTPEWFVPLGGEVYFAAADVAGDRQIWKTDGTSTVRVTSLPTNASPSNLVALAGSIVFAAADAGGDVELWRLAGGTAERIADINPTGSSNPAGFVEVGGLLFFTADDGVHGSEPWVSDGTAAGTRLLADVNPGSGGSAAGAGSNGFVPAKGVLQLGSGVVFSAYDGKQESLWTSAGTPESTEPLPLPDGVGSGSPGNVVVAAGRLYFTAEVQGRRVLFESDGPVAGGRVVELAPGVVGARAVALAATAERLLFSVDDGVVGSELWQLPFDATPPPPPVTPPTVSIGSSGPSILFIGDQATITFTLSAPSNDFTADDVQTYLGTLTDFVAVSSTVYTATFTPDLNVNGEAAISINSGSFTDLQGTPGSGAGRQLYVSTTVSPGVVITADTTTIIAGSSTTITFSVSETGTGFTEASVQVGGGVLSGFTGNGKTFTAVFTVDASATTAAITVPFGAFSNAVGEPNLETRLQLNVLPYFPQDTTPPTVSIESSVTGLAAGKTATITFTFSEPVTGFTAADVLATLGTLSAFTQLSPLVSTAVFTPDPGVNGTASITVAAGAFTDAAGNANMAGASRQIAVDTAAPTVSIGIAPSVVPAYGSATVTFTLSEPVSGFTAADVQVLGGTLSGFTGSGTTYRATISPFTSYDPTPGLVSIAAGSFTDLAGNLNAAAEASYSTDGYGSFNYDFTPPSVAITADVAALRLGQTATITFTLSEPCVGFSAAAILAPFGAITGFTGSGLAYTATYTPPADFAGVVSVAVLAGSFTDLAGNPNTASLQHFIDVNTIVPTVAISTTIQPGPALIAGGTATLRFALSTPSATFDAGDVQVTGGVLSNFTGSGTSYTATFTPLADFTGIATVAVPAGGFTGLPQGQGFAQAVGNANAAGALTPAMAVDTRAPTINVTTSTTRLLVGQSATFTFRLSEPAASFTAAAIQAVNGTLSGFSGSGTSYTAVFTPQPGFLGTGTVGVAAGAFTDVAGNPLASPASVPFSIDTQPPVAIAATPIPAGFHRAGAVLAFDLVMNEPVTVTGTPRIPLVVGSTPRQAVYVGSPDGSRLRFAYTVQAGDNTPVGDRNGPRLAGAIDLAGGSIRDPIGNDVVPALPAIGAADVVIDTTPPAVTVTSSRSLLGAGQTAVITFTLSEPSPDFGPGSIATTGGTLSGFTGAGIVYTALFTPQTNLTGTAVVKVDVGRFSDRAGNVDALAADRSTAVDTALRFAAGTDGQSVVWDREFAYRAASATTIRLPLPASQAAFFTPRTTLSITPNGSTQSIAAKVKASGYDAATASVVVTLDKPVPVTKTAGFGTLVLGGIVPPGARLLAGLSGKLVHEYGAAELLQAGYSPAFVTRFQGGLRTAAADLDDNGFADIIVAPGGVPNMPDPLAPGRRLADTFGSSLRTVAIFDGAPVPAWAPVKLDVGPVLGMATQGGFQVTAGNIVADAAGSGTLELVVASGTKLAVYEVRIAAPGARPVIDPVPIRVVDLGAGRTATGVATGRLFADDPFDDVVVAATTASGRVGGTTTVSILAGGVLGAVRSFPVSSQVESGPSRRLTDVFGFGASVAAGDVDGDGSIDLVLGAGAGGLGNFRVLANEFVTADAGQPSFVTAIAAQLGPAGRFAQYRPPAQSWRPTGGPDYFTPGPVTGPTGQGFNAPVSVRVVNVSTTGSARAEVFAALGAANQTANTVKRFLFTGAGGWTSAAAFDLLPSSAGDLRFRRGAGVRLG